MKAQPSTAAPIGPTRALNCTRSYVGICAVIVMLMMATTVWRQRDIVAVQIHALEPPPPIPMPNSKKSPSHQKSKTLPRFWSANGEKMDDLAYWEKPDGVDKVMGLVFYGRRQTVSILDCYLKVLIFHVYQMLSQRANTRSEISLRMEVYLME